jgi:hypothetical protein
MVNKLFIFDVGQVSPRLNGMANTKGSPTGAAGLIRLGTSRTR